MTSTLRSVGAGFLSFVAGASLLVLAACGKDSSTPPSPPTRAEVYAAILDSTAPDGDGDGIPDDVEQRYRASLGTSATSADSDGDGVDDAAELFGDGWLYFHSHGRAGALGGASPATTAGDAAAAHAIDGVDSDGDGVPDYLEFAGYRYDWAQSRFVLDAAGFRTDPMQYSTDQDAYSDGMEVSGLNMDVAVRAPGNHPLVPAYPDISIELTGWSITLNAEVTTGTGRTLEQGTTWNREVEKTHSQAFEAGIEITPKAEFVPPNFSLETTYKFSSTTTDSTSTSVAVGGNSTDSLNWNEARCSNATEAALLKLYLRVVNRGSAPATNIVPTLSLRVGGADVATFEPPDLSVAMLLPGGVFPPEEGVSWVVDQVGPDRPLMLTDWELRALELGAPVSISVAQKRADVMRLEDGAWARVGDVNDYVGRILSASADLLVDVGAGPDREDGEFIHVRVSADDGPASPVVRLGEAMSWSMGFRRHADGRYSIQLPRRAGGFETVYLRGGEAPDPDHAGSTLPTDDGDWRWSIDPITLALNDIPVGLPGSLSIEQVLGMRLGPLSVVSLRAPRQLDEPGPLIHAAYAVPVGEGYRLSACVSDYDGIRSVSFVDADGKATELLNEGRGPWFFALDLQPSGSSTVALVGKEWIRAESVRTREVLDPHGVATLEHLHREVPLAVVYRPTPRPPVFKNPWYDSDPLSPTYRTLYAQVYPASDLAMDAVDPSSVKVYYAVGATWGSVALTRVANSFEDPAGYIVRLDQPAVRDLPLSSMRLVAQTARLLYTAVPLSSLTGIYTSGSGTLSAAFDYTATDSWGIQMLDLERVPPRLLGYGIERNDYGGVAALDASWKWQIAQANGAPWAQADGLFDVYMRDSQWQCSRFYLGFMGAAKRWPTTGDAEFQKIGTAEIAAESATMSRGWLEDHAKEAISDIAPGYIFVFRTSDRRAGKLIVRSYSVSTNWWTDWCGGSITYDYVIYSSIL